MGNVHALAHRVTALSMACLSSAGVILCALAGFGCNYLSINALPLRNIMTHEGQEFVGVPSMDIGVICESPFFDEDYDRMWHLSQIFFWVGLGLGSLTALMAWALSTCVAPNPCNWRTMSILAAATAVMEVPIFLIFESEPCNMDISRQTCSLSLGAYFNIASVVLWVIMTLWTQLLNPPNWSRDDVDAWRSTKSPVREIQIPASDSGTTDCSPDGESPRGGGGGGGDSSNNDIFVTSTEKGMAVWPMENHNNNTTTTAAVAEADHIVRSHNNNVGGTMSLNMNMNDNASAISDISETDVESGRTSQLKSRHGDEEDETTAYSSFKLERINEIEIPTNKLNNVPAAETSSPPPSKSRSFRDNDGIAARKGAAFVTRQRSSDVPITSPVEQRIRNMGKKSRVQSELLQQETIEAVVRKQQQNDDDDYNNPGTVLHSPSKAANNVKILSGIQQQPQQQQQRHMMETGGEASVKSDDPGCQLSMMVPDGLLPDGFLTDDPCGLVAGEGEI